MAGAVIGVSVILAAAVAVMVGRRPDGARRAGTGTREGPQAQVEAPGNFEANSTAFTVRLRWEPPDTGAPPDAYHLYRDEALLVTLGSNELKFTDESVLPLQTYRYRVRAYHEEAFADTASLRIRTSTAPSGAARLDGIYDVRSVTTLQENYGKYPDQNTVGWSLETRCEEGPCDVVWSRLGKRNEKIRLERKGARYEGTGTVEGFIWCRAISVESAVTISLRVTRGQSVAGQWHAVRFVGSLEHDELPQLGCSASRAVLSVRGTRVA